MTFFPLSIQSVSFSVFFFLFFPHFLHKFSKVIIVCVPCCNRTLVTFTLCFSFLSSIIVDWHQHTVLYNIYIHIGCGNTSSLFGTWHFFSEHVRHRSNVNTFPNSRVVTVSKKGARGEDAKTTKLPRWRRRIKTEKCWFMRAFLFRDVFIYHAG